LGHYGLSRTNIQIQVQAVFWVAGVQLKVNNTHLRGQKLKTYGSFIGHELL